MAIRLPSLSSVSWVSVEKITQQVLWLVLFSILAPIHGALCYGAFCYGFARRELRAFLAEFVARPT